MKDQLNLRVLRENVRGLGGGGGAFHSVTFQLKCQDFQSNQYKKLVPVLSRFCNGLYDREHPNRPTLTRAFQNYLRPGSNAVLHLSRIEGKREKPFVLLH